MGYKGLWVNKPWVSRELTVMFRISFQINNNTAILEKVVHIQKEIGPWLYNSQDLQFQHPNLGDILKTICGQSSGHLSPYFFLPWFFGSCFSKRFDGFGNT
jgi:hypothetical protein